MSIGEGSFLKGFFEKTKNMNPDERALALEMENVRLVCILISTIVKRIARILR